MAAATVSSSQASLVTTNMPLTTIYTPPDWCLDAPYTLFEGSGAEMSTFWRDVDGPGDGTWSACYPYRYAYQHNPTVTAEYSPGVCPSGYVAAQVAQNEPQAAVTSWCCPPGRSYVPQYGCLTTVTTPTFVALNPSTNISISTAFVAVDWYIKVAWASTDLSLFKPASAPLITSVSQTASTASLPSSNTNSSATQTPGSSPSRLSAAATSSSNTATPAHNNTSSGLSTGAEAGIGVGAAIAALLFIAAVIFVFWRRRQRRRKAWDSAPADHGSIDAKYAGDQKDNQQVYEAHGDSRPAEADPSNVRVELQGDWHGNEVH